MPMANTVRYGNTSTWPGKDVKVNWIYEGDLQKVRKEQELTEFIDGNKDHKMQEYQQQ